MKISMEIIYRESKEFNPVMYSNKNASAMKYIGICNVSYVAVPMEEYIQFGLAKDFKDFKAGESLICIGKICESLISDRDILCFPEDTQPEVLYKKLLSIFVMYEEWNNNMQQSMMKQESLQKIVEICTHIFKNPIFIHNMNFNLLASTEANYGRQIWSIEEGRDPVINLDVLNEFKVDKEYQNTLSVFGPAFFQTQCSGTGYSILIFGLKKSIMEESVSVKSIDK